MRLNSCDSEKNNTVLSTNQRLTNKIHSYTPKKKNLLHTIKKNNLTINDKFINLLMKNGNKLKANRIFYDSLKILYFKNLNSVSTHQNEKLTNIHLLQKKYDYSCKKKEFMDVFSSDKETTDINTTLKENSLFNRSCKIDEKLQCVSPAHKNSAEDFFSDNLVLTNANKLFIKAVENVKPSVETRNVKVSGMTYPVPAVIGKHRQQILAIRWLIECATKNKKNTSISFCECLASELYEALISSGKAKQKRDAMHKHAEYNRAYIRFKWW
jgi:ribosomal protein S7